MSGLVRSEAIWAGRAAGGTPGSTGFVSAGAGANVNPGFGNNPWNNPGNITASDDVKTNAPGFGNAAGETSQWLYASNFNFSTVPAGATIETITVRIEKNRQFSSHDIVDHTIQITKDGTSIVGTNKADTVTLWPLGDSIREHVFTAAEAGNSTAAEVKTSTFGVMIRGQIMNTSADLGNIRVDHVQMQVDYIA